LNRSCVARSKSAIPSNFSVNSSLTISSFADGLVNPVSLRNWEITDRPWPLGVEVRDDVFPAVAGREVEVEGVGWDVEVGSWGNGHRSRRCGRG